MGITLNVWVFSGIIGVAYIMGYLMSRTMGRMLAVEGADPEAVRGEGAAWQAGTRGEERERPGKTLRQAAAALSGRASRTGTAAMPGRPTRTGTAAMSEKAAQSSDAPEMTWQEKSEMPEGALWQEDAAMSERAAGYRNAVMPGRRAGQKEAVLSQRAGWPEETEWEEGPAKQEGALLRDPQTQAGANHGARQPYRGGHGGESRGWQKARVQRRYRGRSHREQQAKPAGHPIASPVAGQVDVLEGQGRRGVLLTPEDNRVYAPASGKIIRLYPRGNEFLLRTESGVVLRLRAGERDADMTRDYFRPRIMQNEFVGKGKLLLEYDREALARDGYDTHVSMTVEEGEGSYDLSVTGSMWVKNGQDCLWVL